MSYDDNFFTAYRRYLDEPAVRRQHDYVFYVFRKFVDDPVRVVDIGCGTGEFFHHGDWVSYVGVDETPRIVEQPSDGEEPRTISADYRAIDSWLSQLTDVPDAFVSLFSIEPVFSVPRRYALYEELFVKIPTLKWGLSAGFYYSDRIDTDRVEEVGGIISYQTVEPLSKRLVVRGVSEERLILRVPSKMFGPDVVEVWKFFSRVPEGA
jgi:hypothetical protein